MVSKKAAYRSRVRSTITTLIIVLIAIAGAIGLYMVTPKATPAPPKTEVNLTDTPDYNTCNILTTDSIKGSFNGDFITGISQGVRAGVKAPNDTVADSCGYGLTTTQSLNNSLSVQVYPYTVTINGKDKETVGSTWSEVAASSPKAYFVKDIENDIVIYKLRVIPGGKNVLFELRQPIGEAAFDEPSALDFLVGIAAKADLRVIEPVDEN
jgi:hypothetical protein